MAQKNTKLSTTTSSKQTSTMSKPVNIQSSVKTIQSQEQSIVKTTSIKYPQDIIENYIIIWLDPNLDFSKEENEKLINQLRSIVNTIETLTDINQCIKFLEQIKNEKVFLIISDCFIKEIASFEEKFTQLNSIYIFCNRILKSNEIIQAYKKGKGIFTQMKLLCNELKKEIHQLNHDLLPISIISTSSSTNLNELDPSFMYFQLLKEIVFKMKYDRKIDIQQLTNYCRPIYDKDEDERRRIIEFQDNYSQQTPIWWYTLECFLYHMLNKALRTMEIETIIKMAFFIRDLHEQIKQLHLKLDINEIPTTLYRGQGMFNEDFEKLRKTKDGLLSFNYFLSTTTAITIAKRFASSNQHDSKKTAILFEIKIDPSISSVPFTPISNLSDCPLEEEILFSMSSVFRIGIVEEIDDHLWKVNLTLTDDRDPLLKRLTDHMRISLGDGSGWRQLGQLMIKMGKFDKALEIYNVLLKNVDSNDKAENAFLHNQLGYIWKQKGELKEAFSHYEESVNISRTYMSDIDPRLSSIYSNIGGILKKLGDSIRALKFYQLVLMIDLAAPKPNQLEIAIDHNNIGSVLDDQGKYGEALKSYEQALDIKLTHLPPHHPSLASTYSNIGLIHRKMGDYSTALSFYDKTLQIQQKSLPPKHPSLIVTHGKLAIVLEDLHRYDEAIGHAEKAVNIATDAFGSQHPEVEKRQQYLDKLQQENKNAIKQ
ncbi:unnamed protein product [Rotaria sordida]|uniref:NAD(P)(+)--arginine ADP-ribosyltransferase n=1 Tax=Rotaria sordida TaxID=392033 RepID=A0A814FMM1_9BILA|nr:unnamed protein product [Rotaria sordida]